jgi:hypothetical protein
MKRFIRNHLAITASHIGPSCSVSRSWRILMPYSISGFKTYAQWTRIFASATINRELRYTVSGGQSFPASARAAFVLPR